MTANPLREAAASARLAPDCRLPTAVLRQAQDEGRRRVAAAARAWRGTPWHHMADIKGVGVDCAMLLVRVYVDTGAIAPFDPRPYVQDWMLHRDEERFLSHLLARAREVSEPELGDVMMFKFGRCFAHGSIISGLAPLRIVHAYAPARCVLEEEPERNRGLFSKPHRYFSLWSA